MSTGWYKGVHYRRMRHNVVFPSSDLKSEWWFACDPNDQKPDGSHFRTLFELFSAVEKGDLDHLKKQR